MGTCSSLNNESRLSYLPFSCSVVQKWLIIINLSVLSLVFFIWESMWLMFTNGTDFNLLINVILIGKMFDQSDKKAKNY